MKRKEISKIESSINLSAFADSWPSPYVERQKLSEFSGGLLKPKTMANLDSQGKGPEGRVKVGNKIIYHVPSLIKWLERRASKPSKGKVGTFKMII